MARTEWTPQRLEQAKSGYQRDIKAIIGEAEENGKEMMELKNRRKMDAERIEFLQAENENLKSEWGKIAGKIELIEDLIKT